MQCRFLIWLGLAAGIGCAAPPAPEPPEEAWEDLLNGQDLSGWVPKITGHPLGDNVHGTFRIEDGILKVSYDGYDDFDDQFGHLFYETPFSHYRIRIEYRFVGEQLPGGPDWAWRNSGVMLHSQAPETMTLDQDFPISIEAQFLGGRGDGTARPTANVCTPGTDIVIDEEVASRHCIEAAAPTFDGDVWVSTEFIVLGSEQFVHLVEGDTVLQYGSPTLGGGGVRGVEANVDYGEPVEGGYISLQSESHPIEFRSVKLVNLSGCMEPDDPAFRPYFVHSNPEACRGGD